ncbi:thiol-activated cytolysin family protein [Maribacter algicola]|uniref:Thiol-activated cytolysin family protein n=1 Tax=Meishania litoralis TaxID=3434685 RepID=A0ACC7LLN0_9FLAO
MKTIDHVVQRTFLLILSVSLLTAVSCSKEDNPVDPPIENGGDNDGDKDPEEASQDLEAINAHISNLNYDQDQILNVQGSTGTDETNTDLDRNVVKGEVTECRTVDYNIRSNFEDVVMFDPTAGVIYPGALVIANRQLSEGSPLPLQISKAPTKLRVELPGIGEGGNITISEPNYQNTQAGIDEALEYWNSDIQPQGYEIDSDTYFEKTNVYSSEQMSLDLGVSAEWSKGSSFESQFNYTKTTEKRVATLLYRQVFYDVTMETPESPAAVFGSDVSLAMAQSAISNESPPAYVSSVQYGRIIMMRLETTDTETDVNLEAVLEYKTAKKGATIEIDADFEKVIKESTINIVTIGGNAQVATEVITGSEVEEGKGGLHYVIAEGALYSRDNPGAPIGYTVKYLRDNQIAKMGYNTDYSVTTCGSFPYEHKSIYAKRTANNSFRYRFSYFEQNDDVQKYSDWVKLDDKNVNYSLSPEDGAYNVRVQFQVWDIVWKTLGEFNVGYVNSNEYYEAYCSKRVLGVCTEVSVKEL